MMALLVLIQPTNKPICAAARRKTITNTYNRHCEANAILSKHFVETEMMALLINA